ncbi:hypothetical protein NQP46_00060 [Streptomyces albus]|nr:hypothetical protein NQP46_00060 [Streptomyces albus]
MALLAVVALVVQLVRPLPEPVLSLDAEASSFTIGGGTFTLPWPEQGQAAVMVTGSGTLGTFGEQEPVPTASVAKIMTAYVILRERPSGRARPARASWWMPGPWRRAGPNTSHGSRGCGSARVLTCGAC